MSSLIDMHNQSKIRSSKPKQTTGHKGPSKQMPNLMHPNGCKGPMTITMSSLINMVNQCKLQSGNQMHRKGPAKSQSGMLKHPNGSENLEKSKQNLSHGHKGLAKKKHNLMPTNGRKGTLKLKQK